MERTGFEPASIVDAFRKTCFPARLLSFTEPGALCKPASDTVFGEHDYAALDPTWYLDSPFGTGEPDVFPDTFPSQPPPLLTSSDLQILHWGQWDSNPQLPV